MLLSGGNLICPYITFQDLLLKYHYLIVKRKRKITFLQQKVTFVAFVAPLMGQSKVFAFLCLEAPYLQE